MLNTGTLQPWQRRVTREKTVERRRKIAMQKKGRNTDDSTGESGEKENRKTVNGSEKSGKKIWLCKKRNMESEKKSI